MTFPDHFLPYLRRHLAKACVGPTTLRNMTGVKGKRSEMQAIFCDIDLESFARDYARGLDLLTEALAKLFDDNWGAARKAANLFARDVVNHHATRTKFGLDRIEAFLEVPLDSKAMAGIRSRTKHSLRETSVSQLSRADSDAYQAAAAEIAARDNVARVHLDLTWWAGDEA